MTMQIGEVRGEMALDVQRRIMQILNEKKHVREYYIVITAHWLGNALSTKLIILLKKPPKMLNSACYFIDNHRGLIKRLWVLPADIPLGAFEFESGYGLEDIHRDAKGMPILN